MRAASVTFRPPLWASLGLVAACSLFIAAGIWQLGRADEKRALLASFADGAADDMLDGPVPDSRMSALRYRRIRLQGRFDSTRQVLLDNVVVDGQAGYHVLTPLRTETGSVLVNRGWVAADPDRSVLPDIKVSEAPRQITGQLDRLPVPGIRLEPPAADARAAWPRRALFPTAGQLTAQIGYPVMDYQVLLAPDAADGFRRDWQPTTMTPDTHLGYAVQWFAFAIVLAAIYVVVNLKRSVN
ncbi:MAG: SURF1 family protein [Gammaproteobacteria bacterium]|nr:SURF1 family protein [Gammaproteobacteria bacterium]